MKRKLLIILLVLAVLSGIYPLYFFYFADRAVPQLPPHHTYQQAVGQLLPDSIKMLAAKHGCRGYVLPVSQVQGPDSSFPHLKDDVNLALSAYDGWKLKVTSQEREQMKKRLEENLKKWGAMLSGSELMRIALTQKSVDAQTQTSVTARWFYRNVSTGDDVKLVVTINDELKAARLFQISLTFVHPKTLAAWRQKIEKRQAQIARRRQLARISLAALYGFGGLFVLTLLFFMVQAAVQALKDRRMRKALLAEIGKREELVENGHFVTAYELTQKYLQYFPDDTEIRAFQHRLLDFTNNDPKTAQKAFVEAKKLQARLTRFADDPRKLLLDPQEKSNIQALLPYHPELNSAYHKLLQLEEGAQKRLTVEQQIQEMQTALRGGYFFKARRLLEQIEQLQPEAPVLDVWLKECQLKLQEAEQAFEEVCAFFVLGKLSEGWAALDGFLRQYKDHPWALEVQEDARQAEAQRALVLRWPRRNWQLRLFLQNELILGRQDDGAQPDLAFDDRRISRQHATLRLVNGQVEITDNGSTGGTYVNGRKITTVVLKNGDVLNLAKIKEFKVHETQEPGGKTTGILFVSREINWALVFTHLIFTPQQRAGRKDQAEWQVFFDGNVPVLIHGNRFAVLLAGKTIQFENETIEVEAI